MMAGSAASPAASSTRFSHLLALLTVGGMVALWVLMAELIQGMLDDSWSKPWFATYVIHGGFGLMIVPWAFLYWRRRTGGGPFAAASYADFSVPIRQLLLLSFAIQLLSAFNGFSWYLSLPSTLVALNNTIYQASSAFVFVISVLAIGERVTARKVVAVVVCMAGVVVISFFSGSGSSGPVKQTFMGYVWVVASTAGYSLYEVVYARFTEQRIRSWGDLFSRNFMTQHAAAEHATEEEAKRLVDPDNALRRRSGTGAYTSMASPPLPDGRAVPAPDAMSSMADDRVGLLHGDDTDTDLKPHARPSLSASPALRAEVSALVLGTMGLFTLTTLWPLFFLFHYTGVEPFEWPSAAKGQLLAMSTLLDGLYNVLLLFGIQISSPLFMSVGTMTVIPVSLLADYLIHHATVSGPGYGGILLIVMGWLILQIPAALAARMQGAAQRCTGRLRQHTVPALAAEAPAA